MRDAALIGILGGLLLGGCYDLHGPGDDAGSVGGYDASACPSIGGYPRCGEGCGDAWCSDYFNGTICRSDLEVCLPTHVNNAEAWRDPRHEDRCTLNRDPMDPKGSYCWSGGVCASLQSYPPEEHWNWNGDCVDEAYCDDVDAHIDGVRCTWSDGSERVTGAPVESTCPEADPRARFCGGPCGDCAWPDPSPWLGDIIQIACIGRSDRRGLGVCAANTFHLCERGGRTADRLCGNVLAEEGEDPSIALYGGAPCACIVLEDPEEAGFPEWGWATKAETCLRYAERYPDQVRCYDSEWNAL